MKTPELVGAPIRREDPKINPNKQNIAFKQTTSNRPVSPNRPGMPNRHGLRNKPSDQGRPGSFNRQGNPNRPGSPNRPGMPNRPGLRNKPADQGRPGSFNREGNPNRPGSKFNGQNSSGIRKPVSPNELLQLQKNNNSEKDNLGIKNNAKQNIDTHLNRRRKLLIFVQMLLQVPKKHPIEHFQIILKNQEGQTGTIAQNLKH